MKSSHEKISLGIISRSIDRSRFYSKTKQNKTKLAKYYIMYNLIQFYAIQYTLIYC